MFPESPLERKYDRAALVLEAGILLAITGLCSHEFFISATGVTIISISLMRFRQIHSSEGKAFRDFIEKELDLSRLAKPGQK